MISPSFQAVHLSLFLFDNRLNWIIPPSRLFPPIPLPIQLNHPTITSLSSNSPSHSTESSHHHVSFLQFPFLFISQMFLALSNGFDFRSFQIFLHLESKALLNLLYFNVHKRTFGLKVFYFFENSITVSHIRSLCWTTYYSLGSTLTSFTNFRSLLLYLFSITWFC